MAETDEFVDDGTREGDKETWDQAERNRRAIDALCSKLEIEGSLDSGDARHVEQVLEGEAR